MPERIPQSVAYTVVFKAYLTDGITPATGKTIAITISKNTAAFGNPSAGATNATEIASGWYYVALSTTDTGSLGPLIVHGAVATVDNVDLAFTVANAFNAGFTGVPAAIADGAGGLPISDAGGLDLDTRLDVAVSSRLAAASYTAPNNADIVSIKAKTDNLPSDPSDQSLIIAATNAIVSDIAALPTAIENADALLTRDVDQVESTAPVHSLTSVILKLVSRFNALTGRTYRTNGTTVHMTQTPTTNVAMTPIEQLDVGV